MKDKIVKNIPLMDLASFLLETVDSPKHIGSLQIFQAEKGLVAETIKRILTAYVKSPVSSPFNYVPVFPKLGMPKWAQCAEMNMPYHIRQAALPEPGGIQQLIDMVTDLHAGALDRTYPGWIVYIIEGLESDQFAIYFKVQHAYIDGSAAVMRMKAGLSKSASDRGAIPMWAPLDNGYDKDKDEGEDDWHSGQPKSPGVFAQASQLNSMMKSQRGAMQEVMKTLFKSGLEASGLAQRRHAPVPFSAPKTIFNQTVHPRRSLGIGSIELDIVKKCSVEQAVSINEVILALVGDALEQYANSHGSAIEKPLVAICPMNIRSEGDTSASTQFAALSIKLGEPNSEIDTRLQQVHQSSIQAKTDAQLMSREGLINYLLVVGGLAELLDRMPFNDYLPPLTNVNVSNVKGPVEDLYLSGAKLIKNIPLSTLAGGTAINITFFSMAGQLEYAVITDSQAVPQAQEIADNIESAMSSLAARIQIELKKKISKKKLGNKKKVLRKVKKPSTAQKPRKAQK